MTEKNICMYCGKKSKNRMKFRVVDKKEVYRDFCCSICLVQYYKFTNINMRKENGNNI